ncbi:type II toxin-antitoxin system RelE/ParE family toxin [Pseudomonas sp. RP23018S]|uniref:type II toxin-antitoxin system RelE family toxin n=1 Tax=Pseudomonas sp. RP23018S TaxID=3096037 RepID=UPI002ACA8E23|nr:type II toxin-antitoxin system RelE/ParE family toxin [Pseudomonas sp. RP23018S]MDZ5605277.1 type II toxin-antitoxin system RelE/ParE family toxin [Pseudomonas sp. RP23018S]
MSWSVRFHPEVYFDLEQLGKAGAHRVFKVIEERIAEGEPDKIGKALSGVLAGHRRIRTGNLRIVYKVVGTEIILIVCVGARRDDEVYETATRRV